MQHRRILAFGQFDRLLQVRERILAGALQAHPAADVVAPSVRRRQSHGPLRVGQRLAQPAPVQGKHAPQPVGGADLDPVGESTAQQRLHLLGRNALLVGVIGTQELVECLPPGVLLAHRKLRLVPHCLAPGVEVGYRGTQPPQVRRRVLDLFHLRRLRDRLAQPAQGQVGADQPVQDLGVQVRLRQVQRRVFVLAAVYRNQAEYPLGLGVEADLPGLRSQVEGVLVPPQAQVPLGRCRQPVQVVADRHGVAAQVAERVVCLLPLPAQADQGQERLLGVGLDLQRLLIGRRRLLGLAELLLHPPPEHQHGDRVHRLRVRPHG